MSPVLIPLIGSFAGLVGIAALITAIRESAKWWSERKSNEIGQAVTSLSEVLTQIRAENTRLIEANDRKEKQLEESEKQIEKLEAEIETLQGINRDLAMQSMDAGHREKRMADKYEDLMMEHGKVLRRLEEHGHDAA